MLGRELRPLDHCAGPGRRAGHGQKGKQGDGQEEQSGNPPCHAATSPSFHHVLLDDYARVVPVRPRK